MLGSHSCMDHYEQLTQLLATVQMVSHVVYKDQLTVRLPSFMFLCNFQSQF